ncbi:hypothetical protein BCR33DRAFT_714131 [Rhizoclosmatium globosum]|uniref:D-isomer specific 2-hydroxyacid dehydrogenase NAD-binding domain-containing protein n=1 Tax=Rhizoclosmatium globosum TaxID=329046 RepID=A0A1Y2CPV3_9FUNG|nr:hypothetical protein BCR33DRAFT_714131 [Rhizoclosmatium globosum]|eukprot:ORY49068.1 hypothetical protein BCR33DRAFT_714131 [Rhizoclosmatium globosum]
MRHERRFLDHFGASFEASLRSPLVHSTTVPPIQQQPIQQPQQPQQPPIPFSLKLLDVKLDEQTVELARGFDAVSIFVNDEANLSRVPEYSPHAIAEFACALALAANRRIVPAATRVKTGNFNLAGLVGFDFHGKTVGVIGTGKIGQCFIKIMLGFGCKVCVMIPFQTRNRVISLHCPLTPETAYLINSTSLSQMQDGTLLINTSRGGLINTIDLIRAIKSKKIAAAALDVYENEAALFFEDHSEHDFMEDKYFSRLLSFNNVVVTGHMGFLTQEALSRICETMYFNVYGFSMLDPNDVSKEAKAIREEIARNRVV